MKLGIATHKPIVKAGMCKNGLHRKTGMHKFCRQCKRVNALRHYWARALAEFWPVPV